MLWPASLYVLTLAGCQRAVLSKPDCACDTGIVEGDRVPLWNGFSLRWRDISHRFAYLRAGIGIDPWAETADDAFHAQLGAIGGDWSDGTMWRDFPAVDLAWTWIDVPGAQVFMGDTALRVRGRDHCKIYDANPATPEPEACFAGDPSPEACDALAAENALTRSLYGDEACRVTPDRPQDGRVVHREVVDLDAVGLEPRDRWFVVLAGVCADTDLPLDLPYDDLSAAGLRYDTLRGWTVGGWGAGVGEAVYDPETRSVSFEVWSRFEPGRVRDAYRPDMSLAMNYAQIQTHVRWTLVGVDGPAEMPVRPAGHCAYFDRADRGFPVDTEHPRAISSVGVQPALDEVDGVAALVSFDVDLHDEIRDGVRLMGHSGRYLRDVEARIRAPAFRTADTPVDVTVVGSASVSSLVEEGDLSFAFGAELGLLQLDGLRASPQGLHTFEMLDRLGNWEAPLPAEGDYRGPADDVTMSPPGQCPG